MQIQLFAALAAFAFSIPNIPNQTGTATLTVNISNVEHQEGHVKAVLFDRSNFLTENFVACIEIPATRSQGTLQTVFQHVQPGDYAVAIYQDINDNDWFDRNWIGYPKEPFAMSNNLRPINMLSPDFDDAKVHLGVAEVVNLNIQLLNN